MITAASFGLVGEAFWNLSQYEIGLQVQGARRRLDQFYELGLWIAWHTALFTNAKKLPALGPLLQKLREKDDGDKPQDWRDVKAQMAALRTVTNKELEKKGAKKAPTGRTRARG